MLCNSEGVLLYANLRDQLWDAPGTWNIRQCVRRHCGLLWQDPMPVEDDIGMAYERYYTHKDTAQPPINWINRAYNLAREVLISHEYNYRPRNFSIKEALIGRSLSIYPGWRADIKASVMYLPAKPGGRLLDIGCGDGKTLSSMQALGWQVEGVDFDPQAVEHARRRGLDVHVGTLMEQRYADNSFDAIIMSHLIEHVHKPLDILVDAHRILKPGGRLVIITPNASSLGHRLFRHHWRGLEPPRHLHIFNRCTLGNLAVKAGFGDVSLTTTIHNAHEIFLASYALKRSQAVSMKPQRRLTFKVAAHILRLIEWLVLKYNQDAGEEVTLIGVKTI
jgi:2-polyprenyl-3-methyl-5-hydroxy-6-metoxy-1,4-benzoquinol methylase